MNKKILGRFALFIVAVLGILGARANAKSEKMSDTVLANVESLTRGESVTCAQDSGDTCIVGSQTVPNYDEGCASWFWG